MQFQCCAQRTSQKQNSNLFLQEKLHLDVLGLHWNLKGTANYIRLPVLILFVNLAKYKRILRVKFEVFLTRLVKILKVLLGYVTTDSQRAIFV